MISVRIRGYVHAAYIVDLQKVRHVALEHAPDGSEGLPVRIAPVHGDVAILVLLLAEVFIHVLHLSTRILLVMIDKDGLRPRPTYLVSAPGPEGIGVEKSWHICHVLGIRS